MGAPAGAGERAAQVHRRPVGGEETGDDQRRRPVLRAARAERAEAGEQAREVPGDFAHAVPARRRQGRPGGTVPDGPSGAGSVPTSWLQRWGLLRYRNNKPLKLSVLFQEPVDFAHHIAGPPARETPNAMCVQFSSTASSRSCSSPRAARGAIDPVLARPDCEVRHRRLVGDARDRRLVDLVAGDPFIEPPDIVLLRVAGEWRAQGHHRADPLGDGRAPARARTGRRGSSRRPATGCSVADLRRAARFKLVDRVGPWRPRFQPMSQPWTRQPASASALRSAHGRAVAGNEAGNDQRRRPVVGPERPASSRSRARAAASSQAASPSALRSRRRPIVAFPLSLRGTRPPSAPAAPWAAARARPRSGGSRAAARGCAGDASAVLLSVCAKRTLPSLPR